MRAKRVLHYVLNVLRANMLQQLEQHLASRAHKDGCRMLQVKQAADPRHSA